MIQITDTAKKMFKEFIEAEDQGDYVVRIAVAGRTADDFIYDISLVKEDEKGPDDELVDAGPFKVLVDAGSVDDLKGATIDFVDEDDESGFKVANPNPLWRDARAAQVQRVLEERVNPGVASHGGVVSLLDVRDDTAYIKMGGGCQGCGMANVTLKQGIETAIREVVPSITRVLDQTDHASGANPYYQPAKGGASPFGA